MKKIFLLFVVCLLAFMTACSVYDDKVLSSLGEYRSKEIFTYGEFQDYTDYGVYTYDAVDLRENAYFKQVSENDKEKLIKHIEDFEKWIALFEKNSPEHELVVNYDFYSSIISANDYVYIHSDPECAEIENYDVYFFDTETNTLYYFHNNN